MLGRAARPTRLLDASGDPVPSWAVTPGHLIRCYVERCQRNICRADELSILLTCAWHS